MLIPELCKSCLKKRSKEKRRFLRGKREGKKKRENKNVMCLSIYYNFCLLENTHTHTYTHTQPPSDEITIELFFFIW